MHDHGNCQRCDDLESRAREVLRTGEETERQLADSRRANGECALMWSESEERVAALEADLAAMREVVEEFQGLVVQIASSHPGHAGDHVIYTVQISESQVERARALLARPEVKAWAG